MRENSVPIHLAMEQLSDDEIYMNEPFETSSENDDHDVDVDSQVPGEPNAIEDDYETDSDVDESQSGSFERIDDEELIGIEPNMCTLVEAKQYRRQLRTLGASEFVNATVVAGNVTARKLITAFGWRLSPSLDGMRDEYLYEFLGETLSDYVHKRTKLVEYNSIDDVVQLLRSSQNIMVVTGAGISTSLGIPDFRSKHAGLYSQLEAIGLDDPQEVFDINLFRENPAIFYSIAHKIMPVDGRFTPTHAFIRLLQDKQKLLTNYSQNIDNLETRAGIESHRLIQCHGSFGTASCIKCGFQVPGSDIMEKLRAQQIAYCAVCPEKIAMAAREGAGKKRKRATAQKKRGRQYQSGMDSDDDVDDEIPTGGVMKPDIIFFGEELPDAFEKRLRKRDVHLVDLLIVIGTSLQVKPVSNVTEIIPEDVPQILISMTPMLHKVFDIELIGKCDVVVAELCRRAGWALDHEMIPERQVVSTSLAPGFISRHAFHEQQLNDGNLDEKEAVDLRAREVRDPMISAVVYE